MRPQRVGDPVADAIWATRWIDTHEHLVEETRRLGGGEYRFIDVWGERESVPADWTCLISHYGLDDLVSSGIEPSVADAIRRDGLEPEEKWDLAATALDRSWATGYLRAARLSTEALFCLPLSRDTVAEIDARCRSLRRVGYYQHVLQDIAGVDHCHVHSLEHDPVVATRTPEIIRSDLSLVPLVFGTSRLDGLGTECSLAEYEQAVERVFERWAGAVAAVKCAWAYFRPLSVRSSSSCERAFERVRSGGATPTSTARSRTTSSGVASISPRTRACRSSCTWDTSPVSVAQNCVGSHGTSNRSRTSCGRARG